MYDIVLTREAQKDYQKLAKSVAKRINQCLDNLREYPLQYPQAIPLKGRLAGYYRWRVGDWRVVYEVNADEQIVVVLQITHRSRVYK
ncbi:MAG: type II toxin-antitoxin system RelE/ParE family toxin [Anaerolineae bacterium]|nr:type II toxin-antitoxin system RelE/ParE family toxin [Anaerolineae bacterium]